MTDSFSTHADGFPHIDKDPDATLNYTWDYTRWLVRAGAPTILTAVITPESGITLVGSATIVAGLVTQTIAGGTAGESYKAVCRITTSNGLTDDRTIVLDVRAR